jgi:hypothetical protein
VFAVPTVIEPAIPETPPAVAPPDACDEYGDHQIPWEEYIANHRDTTPYAEPVTDTACRKRTIHAVDQPELGHILKKARVSPSSPADIDILPHPTAGKVIRRDKNIYDRWVRLFDDDDPNPGSSTEFYTPFVSERDWQYAKWAIGSAGGPSQTSLNEMLQLDEEV